MDQAGPLALGIAWFVSGMLTIHQEKKMIMEILYNQALTKWLNFSLQILNLLTNHEAKK